ncbi:MAG: hypothetical protein KBC96_14785 [Armatimonadetes bacterium]|nr:hypothetical protein [Armatimonadota bacterium]
MSQPFAVGGAPMPSQEISLILEEGSPALTRYLGEEIYANTDPEYVSRQRERFIATMRIHAARVGERPTYLLRAPGRLNAFLEYMDICKGDHISTTIDGDIPVAVSPRDDDIVTATNAYPMFPPGRFSISEEVAAFRGAPWTEAVSGGLPDDWASRTLVHPHYGQPEGQWLNYVRSPFLRVAWELPGVELRGADMTFGPSALPLRTGMSSSSAIIVLSFLSLYLANAGRLPEWTFGEVCEMLGEAEWYVGTRGGANDQTTILRNQPNGLLYNRHSRSPLESTQLPPLHGVKVVIANSLWEVSPHLGAAEIVNLRKQWMKKANEMLTLIIRAVRGHLDSGGGTEPGWLGKLIAERFEMLPPNEAPLLDSRPELWDSIAARYAHLGSLAEDLLGVPDEAISELIGFLPAGASGPETERILADAPSAGPDGAGQSECRCRNAAQFFHKQNRIGRSIERILNEADGKLQSGELTADAPDYDDYRRRIGGSMDAIQASLRDDFQVSNVQFERLFEIADGGPGYLGGKLMGAGTGGYAALLIRAQDEEAFCEYLDKRYYGSADNFAEYRWALDELEETSEDGSPGHKAALEMKINLHNALKYPSEQRRAVTFSRGACVVELDRFRD